MSTVDKHIFMFIEVDDTYFCIPGQGGGEGPGGGGSFISQTYQSITSNQSS